MGNEMPTMYIRRKSGRNEIRDAGRGRRRINRVKEGKFIRFIKY